MNTISVAATRWLVAVLLVSGLAACATAPKKAPLDYAALMSKAESEMSGRQFEPALATFTEAAKADPTRKEPWLRTAQLQFDAGNYGRAIVAAEEALQRDRTDQVADSILTVSGLRVAAQSLERLRGNGALASSAATREAEQLASALRATMGAEILAEPKASKPKRRASARAKPASAPEESAAPAPKNNSSSSSAEDPFSALGGG